MTQKQFVIWSSLKAINTKILAARKVNSHNVLLTDDGQGVPTQACNMADCPGKI